MAVRLKQQIDRLLAQTRAEAFREGYDEGYDKGLEEAYEAMRQQVMGKFPNLEMLSRGCMSGQICEWPVLKIEARRLLELVTAEKAGHAG